MSNGSVQSIGTMVQLPGGRFEMGTPVAHLDPLMKRYGIGWRGLLTPETPRHRVELDPFFIDRTPVTNRAFKLFINDQPQWNKDRIPDYLHHGTYLNNWSGNAFPADKGDHPVVYVCWSAAMAYARWAGKRLPTEAEWEYAARGGLPEAEFPWGDAVADSNRANYAASGLDTTTPVERYPANGYGLYDLAGNVWEYCLDAWQEDFYTVSPARNPVAGGSWFTGDDYLNVTARRVIRGGSWGGAPVNLRVTYRDSHPPTGTGDHVGFRCAMPVP